MARQRMAAAWRAIACFAAVSVVALSVVGCDKQDAGAERLLRTAVQNEYGLHTQGEVKVSMAVDGQIVTPWYRVRQGSDAIGPFRKLDFITGRSIFPGGTQSANQNVTTGVRTNPVSTQSAMTFDSLVAIDDVDAFLDAHRVIRTEAGPASVAGRRVVTLIATPRHEGGLNYRILVDEAKSFILGIEEYRADTTLLHARRYEQIQYLPANSPTPTGGGIRRVKRVAMTPAEASQVLGIPGNQIFPTQAPEGFPHRELVKTGAIDSIHVRFTNGTTTGTILAYIRKPRITRYTGPIPPRGTVQNLVLAGRAMVEGEAIGVTYQTDAFSCVEIHTPAKSVLVMSTAGLDAAKSVAGVMPLP